MFDLKPDSVVRSTFSDILHSFWVIQFCVSDIALYIGCVGGEVIMKGVALATTELRDDEGDPSVVDVFVNCIGIAFTGNVLERTATALDFPSTLTGTALKDIGGGIIPGGALGIPRGCG